MSVESRCARALWARVLAEAYVDLAAHPEVREGGTAVGEDDRTVENARSAYELLFGGDSNLEGICAAIGRDVGRARERARAILDGEVTIERARAAYAEAERRWAEERVRARVALAPRVRESGVRGASWHEQSVAAYRRRREGRG